MDEGFIYHCSFSAQTKNLFTTVLKFSPALLPVKGALPIRRHHPFSHQPEQRYNTLDFASKIVCQKGYPSLDSPSFSAQPVYTHRKFACDTRLPQNAKSSGISSSQRMKCQSFLSCGEPVVWAQSYCPPVSPKRQYKHKMERPTSQL